VAKPKIQPDPTCKKARKSRFIQPNPTKSNHYFWRDFSGFPVAAVYVAVPFHDLLEVGCLSFSGAWSFVLGALPTIRTPCLSSGNQKSKISNQQ